MRYRENQRGNIKGFAVLECAAALLVLMPLAVLALGIWDLVRKNSIVSQLIHEEAVSVRDAGSILTNANGQINLDENSATLQLAINKAVEEIETKIRESGFESYRIDGVLGAGSVKDESFVVQYRVTKKGGIENFTAPFTDTAQASYSHRIATTVSDMELISPLLGISVSANLPPTFYSKSLEELGHPLLVSESKLLRLRGEVAWR